MNTKHSVTLVSCVVASLSLAQAATAQSFGQWGPVIDL